MSHFVPFSPCYICYGYTNRRNLCEYYIIDVFFWREQGRVHTTSKAWQLLRCYSSTTTDFTGPTYYLAASSSTVVPQILLKRSRSESKFLADSIWIWTWPLPVTSNLADAQQCSPRHSSTQDLTNCVLFHVAKAASLPRGRFCPSHECLSSTSQTQCWFGIRRVFAALARLWPGYK